jgi:Ricin-type beta-trefoil lectin domain
VRLKLPIPRGTFVEEGCIRLGAEGFFIKNTNLTTDPAAPDGLCMDVRDGAKSDGAVVQQWTCRDSSARSMVWYTEQGDFPGALKLRNFNSDLCLDVRGGSSLEYAQLQQYDCTSNNPAQNFWQTNGPDTVMDLNGNWTDGSTRSAHIYEGPATVNGDIIIIDMSAFGRPNANGSSGLKFSTITVTFPDDKTYTGQLQPPNTITWSNGSIWTRN